MARKKKLSSGLYTNCFYGGFTDREWSAIGKVAGQLDCGWGHPEFWEGYISAVMDCTLYVSPTGVRPYFPAIQDAGHEWGQMLRGNANLDFVDLFKSREVENLEERVCDAPEGSDLEDGRWEMEQASHFRSVADYLRRQAERIESEAKRYDRQFKKSLCED